MNVFVSYARPDEDAAQSVSATLKKFGIDVYIDNNDRELGIAVSNHDAQTVVTRIEAALSASTHLLAIVGEKTKASWWVPFEIGASRARSTKLSTIVLDNEVLLPEYLQIVPLIRDRYDLRKWIADNSTWRMDEALVKSASANVPRLPDFSDKAQFVKP